MIKRKQIIEPKRGWINVGPILFVLGANLRITLNTIKQYANRKHPY